MKSFNIYIDFKEKKWDNIILEGNNLEILRHVIQSLYEKSIYNSFKYYNKRDTIYDLEIQRISKILNIEPKKIYFYNNIILHFISSSSYIIKNDKKLIQIIQYDSDATFLRHLFINVNVYQNTDKQKMLFSGLTIIGYVGFLKIHNNESSISIIKPKKYNDNYNFNYIDPSMLIRMIFEKNFDFKRLVEELYNTCIRLDCTFIISNKNGKYRAISKSINDSRYLNNIYYIGTESNFIIITEQDRQLLLEKKMLDILKYPIDTYTNFEKILYGNNIQNYIEKYLINSFLTSPFCKNNTLFFLFFSITDDFYCPKYTR